MCGGATLVLFIICSTFLWRARGGVGVGWVANPYSQSGTKGSRFTIELSQFEMSNARAWRCPPAP